VSDNSAKEKQDSCNAFTGMGQCRKKMAVFWDVALPCSLVEVYRRFRDTASIIRAIITIIVVSRNRYIQDVTDCCLGKNLVSLM
jgi:hypothetical protein